MTGIIERLFAHADARARHLCAPMLFERESYLAYLLRTGHARRMCRERSALLLHCVRLLNSEAGVPVGEMDIVKAATAWADEAAQSRHDKRQSAFKAAARSWCKFLGTYTRAETRGRFDNELRAFTVAMSSELGYLEATIKSCGPAAERFLVWVSDRADTLDAVSHEDTTAYFDSKRAAGWSHRTCSNEARSVRAFLRFAETRGWTAAHLRTTLRVPKELQPRAKVEGPPWKQVRRMIGYLDGSDASHCRAKAILLLASVYGLRRSELVRMTLDDFDWPNAVMTVRRSKRGRIQQFPLANEVGEAIIRYLHEVRPPTRYRELFLTLHAPHRPATNLGTAMRKVINGQGAFDRDWGLHALRHACATELLRQGTSLRGIADFLGHRGLQSVSIYAHCDHRALRRVSDFDLGGVL